MRAARAFAEAASRVSFLACVRTRRPVERDGVVALVRRAAGLRLAAAGLRLAAAGFFAAGVEVVVFSFSAMWLCALPFRFGILRLCSPRTAGRTYVRKP